MTQLVSSIRSRLKNLFDGINNEQIKRNLLQAIPFWVASLITGLVAVGYAILFGWAESGAVWILHHHGWWMLVVTPVCFVAAWWLVKRYAPYARGSGIPQVIAAIELSNPRTNDKVGRLLSLRIIAIKIVSSLVMVVGGGVVGREGPTIQIAASIFRKVNQWLPNWWPRISRRNMVKAGAAAGLAAAFNTPLGGLVFAVEELTRTHISYFKTALFTAVIIAGLTAQGLLGPYLYLGYPEVGHLSSWLFFVVILVGIIAGLGGSGLAKGILVVLNWMRSFQSVSKHILYTVVCALVIAVIGVYFDERMFGTGKEIMAHALFTADKELPWYVPLFRMAGSLLSFTTGGAGGVFAPALGAGAGVGSVVGSWFHLTDGNMNVVVLAGMVAFLTGITRTPFTSFILVLEMTDRHNVIFHLMLAGMVASLVSYLVDRHSFYDRLKLLYKKELLQEDESSDEKVLPAGNDAKAPAGPGG